MEIEATHTFLKEQRTIALLEPIKETLKFEKEDFLSNEQEKMPLFESVREYMQKDMSDYHTPGHKQGKGVSQELLDLVGRDIFKMDLTEIPNIDNFYTATTVIKESQELLAKAYGADHSFFLINGSTSGNQVMIMSVCKPNDKIILPRNIHKSVISAVVLSGAIPLYVPSLYEEELGMSHGINLAILEKTLIENPDAKAVMIVNPTYFGTTVNIKEVVNLVHRYNRLILVDEAHGAHFKFNTNLPMSAVEAGADMVIQSPHKIIASLSQTSWIHVNGPRVDVKRVKKFLQIMQSTSPSYIFLTSLDVARKQMAVEGQELLDRTIELAEYARAEINKIPNVRCFGKEVIGQFGIYDYDVTKLVIDFTNAGISGFKALDLMNQNHNIQPEMATLYNVLCLVTIGNDRRDLDRLIESVRDVATNNEYTKDYETDYLLPEIPAIPKMAISPREAFYADLEEVNFSESAGRISAEVISPYPPGIPILIPGEIITDETIYYLRIVQKYGAVINGAEDPNLKTIKVVKE
ncbi:MAG: aminotransferase class I/II-fold pyridoxal phosphate-dependent enzyme [Candidatus Sericytochromatia bacterium]